MGFFSGLARRQVSYAVVLSGMHAALSDLTVSRFYDEQPALRAVVSFIADNVAQLPMKVFKREGDTSRPRVTEGVAAGIVAMPNRASTAHELMRDSVSDLLLYGEAIWCVEADACTPSGWAVTRIPQSWVSQRYTSTGFEVESYQVTNPSNGLSVRMGASSVIRFAGYSPTGDLSPASPVAALKGVLAEQMAAYAYRNNVWRNGGMVSATLERPASTQPWTDEQRSRFAAAWKSRFSAGGIDSGGTPILEDGMRLVQHTFNAREAEWSEATKLSRQDVAAVYHVNPQMVWHTDGATYASAKDNARALYTDVLAPILDLFEERINAFLLPMVGADRLHYVEFDLDAKLRGSFEERAAVIQSSVGAPWLLRNEARAQMNLPALDGGDELIVPLNVVEGGLASPRDTGGKSAVGAKSADPPEILIKARGGDAESDAMAEAIAAFARRQRPRVLAEVAKGGDWWDAERWDRELADDLAPLFRSVADAHGAAAASQIGGEWSPALTSNYVLAMARGKAHAFNEGTRSDVARALSRRPAKSADGPDDGDEAMGGTPEGCFDMAEGSRAERAAVSFATAVAGWAVIEAAHQSREATRERRVMKVWRTGGRNPRRTHLSMNGERVGIDERFSNGSRFPGDPEVDASEGAYCRCSIDVIVR
ncbi:phage portal protein [Eggerthellaceae bacterium zg-997]|nr:phage portal protein [Eggerthellaceae bacterium zg-997]